MDLDGKYSRLKKLLTSFDQVAVAFSGGVDSTLLLKVATDCLGAKQVLAFTAVSPIFPAYEIEQSQKIARELGVRQELITTQQLELDQFTENGPQRCFHCKQHLFSLLLKGLQGSNGTNTLLDGSNLDDLNDYRPGQAAVTALNIRSPLLEAEFTKKDIRDLSRRLDLETWDKQPFACLATRFPYGTEITPEGLHQVDVCETWLRENGFSLYRVRSHGSVARIEVAVEDMPRLMDNQLRRTMISTFKENGFDYITLDLQGYRSGSLNETLPEPT